MVVGEKCMCVIENKVMENMDLDCCLLSVDEVSCLWICLGVGAWCGGNGGLFLYSQLTVILF